MDVQKMLAEVRSVVHQAPSTRAWEELCALFDGASGAELELALGYAMGALRAWPDAFRTLPTKWLGRSEDPRRQLARALRVGSLKRKALGRLLGQLEGLTLGALDWQMSAKHERVLCDVLGHPSASRLHTLDLRRSGILRPSEVTAALGPLPIVDLRLGANPEIGDDQLVDLILSSLDTLEHLNLDGHYFREGLMARLNAQLRLPKLRSLSLAGCHAKAPTRDEGAARMEVLGQELGALFDVDPEREVTLPELPGEEGLRGVLGVYVEMPPSGWASPMTRQRWLGLRPTLHAMEEAGPSGWRAHLSSLEAQEHDRVVSALEHFSMGRYEEWFTYYFYGFFDQLDFFQQQIVQDWMYDYDQARHVLALSIVEGRKGVYEHWVQTEGTCERGAFSLEDDVLLLKTEGRGSLVRAPLLRDAWRSRDEPELRFRGRLLRRAEGATDPFWASGTAEFAGVDWERYFEAHQSSFYELSWE